MNDLVHSPRITTHDVGGEVSLDPTGIGTHTSSTPATGIGVRSNVINGGENYISGIHSVDTYSDIGTVSIGGGYCNTSQLFDCSIQCFCQIIRVIIFYITINITQLNKLH